MAYGDIHNTTGTICKAQREENCPFSSDEGHSPDVESYVDYHVRHSEVDGDAVRAMIADGTPPRDAVEVAQSGDFEQKPVTKSRLKGLLTRLKGDAGFFETAPSTPEQIEAAEAALARDFQRERDEKAELFFGEDRSDLNDVERFERAHLAELKEAKRGRLAFIHSVDRENVYPNGAGETEVIGNDGTVFVYDENFELSYVVDAETEARDIALAKSEEWTGNVSMLAGEYEDNYDGSSPTELKRMNRSYRRRLAHIKRVPEHWVVVNDIGQIEVYQSGKIDVYDDRLNSVERHHTEDSYWMAAEKIYEETRREGYDNREGVLGQGIARLKGIKDETVAVIDAEVISNQEQKLIADRFRRARIAGFEDSIAVLKSRFRKTIHERELKGYRGDLS